MLFTTDELLRLLRGLNPWWSGRVPAAPDFRRSMFEQCRRHVSDGSEPVPLLLCGPRGVGKTTLLLQIAADLLVGAGDPRRILYLDLAHPMFHGVALPQILRLHRDLVYRRDRPAVLLLDEMPCEPGRDEVPESLRCGGHAGDRIIATRSVRRTAPSLVTETESASWNVLPAPTLSFREFLAMRGLDPLRGAEPPDPVRAAEIDERDFKGLADSLLPARAKFRAYLVAARFAGRGAQSHESSRGGVLAEDRVDDGARYDAALRSGQRNLDELTRLFAFLCLRSGDVFPVQRYARAAGLAASTVAGHLDLLESCFLVRRLAPFVRDDAETPKPRYRVLVSDATLRSEQLMRDEPSLADPEELQRAAATAIVRHLAEGHSGATSGLRYRRDSLQDGPLDLVACEAGRSTLYRIELQRSRAPEIRADLLRFCRREYIDRAFLVTTNASDVAVSRVDGCDTEFVRMPAHVLAYAFGPAPRGERPSDAPQHESLLPVLV